MHDIKLFILNNKKWFMVISLIAILVFCLLSYYFIIINGNKDDLYYNENTLIALEKEENVYTENEMIINNQTKKEFISVDIKGKVKKPGVYRIDISLNKRVSDVVAMAGGLLNDADTTVTNLAKKLFDEMVIIIYSKEQVKEFSKVLEKQELENNICKNECDSCIEKDEVLNNKDNLDVEKDILININIATKEELMTLPGIGESKALAIIEYRNENPFEKIEDIMNITGIKESAFEKIKDYITV